MKGSLKILRRGLGTLRVLCVLVLCGRVLRVLCVLPAHCWWGDRLPPSVHGLHGGRAARAGAARARAARAVRAGAVRTGGDGGGVPRRVAIRHRLFERGQPEHEHGKGLGERHVSAPIYLSVPITSGSSGLRVAWARRRRVGAAGAWRAVQRAARAGGRAGAAAWPRCSRAGGRAQKRSRQEKYTPSPKHTPWCTWVRTQNCDGVGGGGGEMDRLAHVLTVGC